MNALKSWATRAYPDYWLIILGGMFLLIVLFLPEGLVGAGGEGAGPVPPWRKPLPPEITEPPCAAPAPATAK